MVSERSLDVLRAIVQDYVSSCEPVGSKSIVERHSFGVSAATIRNDMALLEEEELIAAPHTSSGRIPTDKGYRLFVDHLAEARPLSPAQRTAIEILLGQSVDLDDVLSRTVRLLSQLTNQTAIVQYPSLSRSRIRHIELVSLAPRRLLSVLITDSGAVEQRVIELTDELAEADIAEIRGAINGAAAGLSLADAAVRLSELPDALADRARALVAPVASALLDQIAANRQDRLMMAGAANLVRTGDDFPSSITPVLEAIEEQVVLLRLFDEMAHDQHSVAVSIGRENDGFGLTEASVMSSGYSSAGADIARVGLIGPLRMDYSGNMAAVRAVARYLSRLLGD
ncbi:HrcA family transcriptional regulator [Leifsonia xyli subsp. xyli]|uniref:Heat-inducible transcription repressor HrcA n=2 Tax=Leifsonia xyli subsp. xyli TaxID=59736 RepID=HRCA_LEIXX|nr:heat-inducible transcriptional repressor HrcA [Leifsonia xyli]Q6AEB9.1 RecName: Full=Heat-inducible transcription repressor HrcA [Leifsonia xyli subsp. xyli str. CTCB07]AAT89277.1 transcriptional regulator, HrcA family [Leifsonia xyli subsp. xyli str. CTCB07]ODA90308.1 HrcA family transcriptional regulator [Leifsonia xyli subsp. xyli]